MHQNPLIDLLIVPIAESQATQLAICAALVLMGLDIVFGVAKAITTSTFSSSVMRAGFGKKVGSLGIIIVADVFDGMIGGGLEIGFDAPVLLAVCVGVAIMEAGSILENCVKINPNLAGVAFFRRLMASQDILNSDEAGEE